MVLKGRARGRPCGAVCNGVGRREEGRSLGGSDGGGEMKRGECEASRGRAPECCCSSKPALAPRTDDHSPFLKYSRIRPENLNNSSAMTSAMTAITWMRETASTR